MSTIEPMHPSETVSPRKLWVGLAFAAAAWVGLGCLDLAITWRACMTQEDYGIPIPRPEVRIAYFVLALVLLALTTAAGMTSYRNWRRLSSQSGLLDTQAVDRCEFMAMIGVIVSVTLGMGIVFLALPPLFLDLCWRAR